jgi:hypothetical protein
VPTKREHRLCYARGYYHKRRNPSTAGGWDDPMVRVHHANMLRKYFGIGLLLILVTGCNMDKWHDALVERDAMIVTLRAERDAAIDERDACYSQVADLQAEIVAAQPTPTPTPKPTPTPRPEPTPTPGPRTHRNDKIVDAEFQIKHYIEFRYGFPAKHIKFDFMGLPDCLREVSDTRAVFENGFRYRNASNAEMRNRVTATIEFDPTRNGWKLVDIQFQREPL